MIIVEKNTGEKIAYTQSGTVVSFGGGELSLNCASYQRDWGVHLDVCANADGNLVIGTESGQKYVAQLDIPAREYIYPEQPETAVTDTENGDEGAMGRTETEPPVPVALDMEKVTLSLWAIGA